LHRNASRRIPLLSNVHINNFEAPNLKTLFSIYKGFRRCLEKVRKTGKLGIGYVRAGRLMDQLEAAGIVGSFEGSKARKVIIQDEISLENILKSH
jgi:hypothetical protein